MKPRLLVLDHRKSVGALVCGASGFCVERKGALTPRPQLEREAVRRRRHLLSVHDVHLDVVDDFPPLRGFGD